MLLSSTTTARDFCRSVNAVGFRGLSAPTPCCELQKSGDCENNSTSVRGLKATSCVLSVSKVLDAPKSCRHSVAPETPMSKSKKERKVRSSTIGRCVFELVNWYSRWTEVSSVRQTGGSVRGAIKLITPKLRGWESSRRSQVQPRAGERKAERHAVLQRLTHAPPAAVVFTPLRPVFHPR